jgi:hypothetical protein
MNGRFWHDKSSINKTNNVKIKKIITKNLENDVIKLNLAKSLNKSIYYFWDDKKEEWIELITKLYGTQPTKTLKEAEDYVSSLIRN